MRIAVVHSFYRGSHPSGENRVVEDQVRLLRNAGHEVLLVGRKTDELKSLLYPFETAFHLSRGTGFEPMADFETFKPDIVHIHNLFPNFATNWTQSWEGPIVVSLHNYRSICANGLFFRNGRICTKCADTSAINSVVFGCYRDSRWATAPVALSRARDRRNLLWRADAVVTTSPFADNVMKRFIGPSFKTRLIPNFGNYNSEDLEPQEPNDRWMALGRFSPEKGFVELVEQWPENEQLFLFGEGTQRSELEQKAKNKNIVISKPIARKDMRNLLKGSLGLVFPSRWFEVDPQVVVEAMALGVPVVALHGNATADIVTDSGAGAVYGAGQSLEAALNRVRLDREMMSGAAILEYSRRWTPSVWLASMTALYEEVRAGIGNK